MNAEGELVLLEPKDKPAFIGLLLYMSWAPSCTNINMFSYYQRLKSKKIFPPPAFHLQFELYAEYCNIRILCSNPLDVHFYKGIKYDSDRLISWLKRHQNALPLNFGHLASEHTPTSPKIAHIGLNPPFPAILRIDRISLWVDFGINLLPESNPPSASLNIVKNTT